MGGSFGGSVGKGSLVQRFNGNNKILPEVPSSTLRLTGIHNRLMGYGSVMQLSGTMDVEFKVVTPLC